MNTAHKYDIMKNHNDYEPPVCRTYVKGLASVNHQRNLSDYAEELVAHYAKFECDQYELSLDMVPEEEQNELLRLYIESIDREIEWACYGLDESINSDFLCDMLAMLKNNDEESRQKFAETTRKNLLTYYKNTLESLLATGCDIYYNADIHEVDYRDEYLDRT